MRTIQVTDDLVLELWPGEGDDRTVLKLRSLSQERDGETPPGMVIIYLEEVRRLIAALIEATCIAIPDVTQNPHYVKRQSPPPGG